MTLLEEIRMANPHIEIYDVHDDMFRQYGRVINDFDAGSLIETSIKAVQMPESASRYIPSVEELEALSEASVIKNQIYGQMDVQIGICLGYNNRLNALEFHKNSEINIAVTDLVLLLARQQELDIDNRLDTKLVKGFLLKKGDVAEIYATTLHFCPCEVREGFSCIVVLPRDTNTPLEENELFKKDELLFAKNKWLLAHEENASLIKRGGKAKLYGENYIINPLKF